MELKDLAKQAIEVKDLYSQYNKDQNQKEWGIAEYMQGFVGDVGDLTKLIMAKNGFRYKEDVDNKIAHELSDCLWCVFVLANEMNIDIEEAFSRTMKDLKEKINHV